VAAIRREEAAGFVGDSTPFDTLPAWLLIICARSACHASDSHAGYLPTGDVYFWGAAYDAHQ
jgi:hypothetical protein